MLSKKIFLRQSQIGFRIKINATCKVLITVTIKNKY